MRRTSLVAVIVVVALAAALMVAGCASSTPEPPSAATTATPLDSAIAAASTACGQASTYVTAIKQPIADAPPNTALQNLQTTLNAAAAATTVEQQRALAEDALTQFDAIIEVATEELNKAAEGSPEQDQLQQLVDTLVTGRDALAKVLK